MRSTLTHSLMLLLAGCLCSPAAPSQVTLRIRNTSADPIYVDATQGRLGLQVKREVGGALHGFDDLACECRFCERACEGSCRCPDAGSALTRQVAPLEIVERLWNGVVQTSGTSTCGDGTCLNQVNAPLDEAFTLELCFTHRRPSGMSFDDGGVSAAQLPLASLACTQKQFRPRDGLVEIGPQRGAACQTQSDCPGEGELCLDGSCTAGCPANEFPDQASPWTLAIAPPDDMEFFETTPLGEGTQLTGTGTVTSVLFQGSTLKVALRRVAPGGAVASAMIQVTLPPNLAPPVSAGMNLFVVFIDAGKGAPNRALVFRDASSGDIVFAADMARSRALLTSAQVAPFSVTHPAAPVGCRQDGCGKFVFQASRLTSGSNEVQVTPGHLGTLTLTSGTYRFLNITSGAYSSTRCDVGEEHPWALWRETGP